MACLALWGLTTLIALSGTSSVAGSKDAEIQQRITNLRDLMKAADSKVENLQLANSGLARKLQSQSNRGYALVLPQRGLYALMKGVNEVLGGALVVFLGAGAAMNKAGGGRGSMATSASGLGASLVGFYLFGYAFGLGGPFNSDGFKTTDFIGYTGFAGTGTRRLSDDRVETTTDPGTFFYYWACAALLSCIISTSLANRIGFAGDMIYTFFLTTMIWPFIVGASWGGGFLMTMSEIGFADQCGSGIIFLTGGLSSLLGCIIAGRRPRRFPDDWSTKEIMTELPEEYWPGSLPLMVTGTFAMWFGWYGLGVGSIRRQLEPATAGFMAAHMSMNITLAAASGGIVVFLLRYAMLKRYEVTGLCNGILAGLVSISAGCGNIETGSALVTGMLGGLFYQAASMLIRLAKVDDQSDAFAIYGVCGIWGCLAAAFFDWGNGMAHGHGRFGFLCVRHNSFCSDPDENFGGQLFSANVALIFFIILWAGALSGIIFLFLKLVKLLGPPEEPVNEVEEEPPDEPLASI